MARPIEATPVLIGEEAAELAASLEKIASTEEIERRKRASREFLAKVTRLKGKRERDRR